MQRSKSSSTYRNKSTRRPRSEGHVCDIHRTRSKERTDSRRQAWLIQQEREREHEIRKQKMILEYELKREAILRSHEHSITFSLESRNKNSRVESKINDYESESHRSSQNPSKPYTMSEKFKLLEENTPLFRGPIGLKISTSELRCIKVDIHRNISGPTAKSSELQRDVINPEEITLERKEDEGMKPIFDREELKLSESTCDDKKEYRIIKTIDQQLEANSPRRLSMPVRPSRCLNQSSENLYFHRHRYEPSLHHKKILHRSQSNDSPITSEKSSRRYRERSRGRQERDESKEREKSRDSRIPDVTYYVQPVPVPVFYGNFPLKPAMMGPMMSMHGPMIRNRNPGGPFFHPRFAHPEMYSPGFPPNPRFTRMF